MSTARWLMGVGVLGTLACALWPLSRALLSGDVLLARATGAALTVIACAVIWQLKGGRPALWLWVSAASALGAILLFIGHLGVSPGCVADYAGRPTVIGRQYTTEGLEHLRANPDAARDPGLLLLDVGGDATLVWTGESVRSCRLWLGFGALVPIPLLALSLGSLVARGRQRFIAAPWKTVAPAPMTTVTPVYDAFLSYRHSEPDRAFATDILESLEERGLRLAIDVRDFAPNEHFLSEMERCIKESRFVLCIVTSQYLASDHTSEEAIISKTLDMAERRKRLVPLIFERVELPVWLHGLVGIDFTSNAVVDPLERLVALLTPRPAHPNTGRSLPFA
jgi:hypothetical protein